MTRVVQMEPADAHLIASAVVDNARAPSAVATLPATTLGISC